MDTMSSTSTARSIAGAGYRPDIDGLRGLAVLSVVLYHISADLAPKGFLGVDLFFVISGFVITKLLSESGIGAVTFYTRRINRLFPSLLVFFVLAIVVQALFLPEDFIIQQSRDGFFASIFLSNFNLWQWVDYFYTGASGSLYLHTWSLSVEEQFYILFPVLFYLFKDKPARILTIALFFLCISLAGYLMETDAKTRFYFSHLRFWEILAGATACLAVNQRGRIDAIPHLQAAAIVVMIVLMSPLDPVADDTTARLLVVMCSVVAVAIDGRNNRLATNSVAILLGKISYPLFLLHFPVLLILSKFSFSPWMIFVSMSVVAIFSYLLFRFVETPIRVLYNNLRTAGLLSAGLLCMATIMFLQWAENDIYTRMNVISAKYKGETGATAFLDKFSTMMVPCQGGPDPKPHETPERVITEVKPVCLQSQPGSNGHDLLIIGDSHAQHLVPGLVSALPDSRILFVAAGLPTLDHSYYRAAFEKMLRDNPGATAIVSSNWYYRLVLFGPENGFTQEHLPGEFVSRLRGLGYNVVVVTGAPVFEYTAEACKFDWWGTGNDGPCFMRRAALDAQRQPFQDALRRSAEAVPGTRFVDLADLVCTERVCTMLDGDMLMYRDQNHLTLHGSDRAAAFILESIGPIGARRAN